MPFGVQTLDEFGRVLLDTGDRVGRRLGAVITWGMNGSMVIGGENTGEFFYIGFPRGPAAFPASRPDIVLNGNVLSWTYPPNRNPIDFLIHFGVR